MKKKLLTKFDMLMEAVAFAEENELDTARTLLNEWNNSDTDTINNMNLTAAHTAQAAQ